MYAQIAAAARDFLRLHSPWTTTVRVQTSTDPDDDVTLSNVQLVPSRGEGTLSPLNWDDAIHATLYSDVSAALVAGRRITDTRTNRKWVIVGVLDHVGYLECPLRQVKGA